MAQVPVVTNASKIQWDHDLVLSSEFRIYIAETPNILPDGTSFVAQVAVPALEWLIQGLTPGHKYCVVTAYGSGPMESGPSNEVEFIVFNAPLNLRIIIAEQLGIDAKPHKSVLFLSGYAD
jgi:hypothetical protein